MGSTGATAVLINDPTDVFLSDNVEGALMELQSGRTALASLRVGDSPASTYTVEAAKAFSALTVDTSVARIRATASASVTRVAQFWGATGLRVEVEDAAGVVDGTDPYLYGLRVRMVPRVGRNNAGIDDVVGVAIFNKSFADLGTVFNGTEALYVGHSGGATKDWNAGVGIDTIADNGMYIVRGPYNYGILMNPTTPFTTAAMRIPNAAKIVGRNQAGSADLDILQIDGSNNLKLGTSAVKVVVGSYNASADPTTNFEIHAPGTTDGNFLSEHMRIVDTTAFAANEGGGIGFAGYMDATPNIRTYAAVAGRKANATSGNAAGYLSLFSRSAASGLLEVLRLNELQQVVVSEASDIVLGTTTGSKIGTATSQKLAFWNKTPIVQPTTAITAAAFVANTSAIANDTATFGGYTIGKIAAALIAVGILT